MSDHEEETLVLIKPGAYEQANEIENRYGRAGLRVRCHRTVEPTPELIAEHYTEHFGKPFYEELVTFMLSGPIRAFIVVGFNAIQRVRELNGPTDPAKATPGHIRYDFGGKKIPRNAVHASDSTESAGREIALWFPNST